MIIHASKDFAKRFKCELSGAGQTVLQAGRLDAWSGHVFRVRRISFTLLMNDATLYSIIIPTTGLTTLPALLKVFLPRVSRLWAMHGASLDPDNQSVMVLPRSNRSLIGSMNEAVKSLQFFHDVMEVDEAPFDLTRIETRLNDTYYKAINQEKPARLLPKLLAGVLRQ